MSMTEEEYRVLGDEVAREFDVVGDGFDYSSLANFAGKAAGAGVEAASSAAQKAADKKSGKKTDDKKADDSKKDDKLAVREEKSQSFFTARHAGIPTWGWLLGGTAIGGGVLWVLLRKRK